MTTKTGHFLRGYVLVPSHERFPFHAAISTCQILQFRGRRGGEGEGEVTVSTSLQIVLIEIPWLMLHCVVLPRKATRSMLALWLCLFFNPAVAAAAAGAGMGSGTGTGVQVKSSTCSPPWRRCRRRWPRLQEQLEGPRRTCKTCNACACTSRSSSAATRSVLYEERKRREGRGSLAHIYVG